MSWWKRQEKHVVDPTVADRLERVAGRLETFAEKLERELQELRREEGLTQ